MYEQPTPDEFRELQHQWNKVLVRDNLSTRRAEKLPWGLPHMTRLKRKFLSHPTAQYEMSFKEFKRQHRKKAKKYFA